MSVDRLVEKIDLFLSAKGLAKLHTFNLTDSFAVLYLRDLKHNTLTKIYTTELIRDSRDPQWATVVPMDFLFECVQEIVVRVYQEEGGRPLTDETKHGLIGETRFRLSDLMCAAGQRFSLSLQRAGVSEPQGHFEVRAEPRASSRDLFVVSFAGTKLANKDGFFGRSDPYLVISRCNEDGSYTVVWRSVRIDNNLNPKWAQVKIPMSTLCNCDIDRPLRIEIFDYDEDGSHDTMGVVETSVRAMASSNGAPMNVVETAKKGKRGYTNSGMLQANGCFIEAHPSLADFIAGGLEISLSVAIDFTGSNGDPKLPNSLHYLDPTGHRLNQYEEAILAVGSIIESYDTDKEFPVCGFGARCPLPDGSGNFSNVQHCFPLLGGSSAVKGISGILEAYRAAVPNLMLSGPTLFDPLLRTTMAHVASLGCSQGSQKYNVLLILTDGVINDMEATKAALVSASSLPLSVIIVGVGSADFSEMNALDSDGKLLRAGSATAVRDIVQFVAYREAAAGGGAMLAQQVLAEIPSQVLQYMEKNNIKPHAKK